MPDKPGIPHPIKLQEQHKALFPLDKPITEESGKLIAQWAQGAKKAEPPSAGPSGASLPLPAAATDGSAPSADEALLIKAEEFASCGTERYKAWWLSITEAQRKAIGEARHATFKQIAAEQA